MPDRNIIADPLFERDYSPFPLFPMRYFFHWHIKARVTDWPGLDTDDPWRAFLGRAVALSPGQGGIYQWIGFSGERRDLHFGIRADGGVPINLKIIVEYLDLTTNTSRRVEHLKSLSDVTWLPDPLAGFGAIDVTIERAPDAYIGGFTVVNATSRSESELPVYVGRFDLTARTVDRNDPRCPICRAYPAMRSRSLEVDSDLLRPDYGQMEWQPPALASTVIAQSAQSDWLQTIDQEMDSLSHRVERLEKLLAKRKIAEPA
jgi:hypothetical protein